MEQQQERAESLLSLTDREIDLLVGAALGETTAAAAERTGYSAASVRTCLFRAKRKLNMPSIAAAVFEARHVIAAELRSRGST